MATKRKPKTKKIINAKSKIKIPQVKLVADAQKIFSLIQKDVMKRIFANAKIESKRNYKTKNAIHLWQKMSVALISKTIEKDLKVSTKSNAKNRREWCKKNNAVIVDMSLVTETDLGDINKRNKKGKKTYRPENALRIRLDKISQGKNLGYVRVISDYDFQNDINLDKSHLVFIYKK
jgi:hypothetical protein